MTFLSVSSDAFPPPQAAAAPASRTRAVRAPVLAQVGALVVFTVALTVPGAVAQAKWTRLHLIVTFVQQRCLTSFST